MQRMISHPEPLPPCAAGHRARHMHDVRARHAGGGHLIECACRQTGKRDDYAQALHDWHRLNGLPLPAAQRPRSNVHTLRSAK